MADLEKALKAGRGRLDASTIAIVEHNLQIIDQAINQAREALAGDPANSYLSSHLVEARRRKLDLLRRATALANGNRTERLRTEGLTLCWEHFSLAMMAITPTDQTVQVAKGTKLDVNNFAGDVNIKVWDKDAVRVEVNNSDRETVDIKQGEQTLTHPVAIAARRAAALARLHDQRAVVDGRSPSPAPTPT